MKFSLIENSFFGSISESTWQMLSLRCTNASGDQTNFGIIKGELDIRPIFHRKNDHVVAHVLICQLSHLLMALMDRQTKESRLDMTSISMVKAFSNVTLNGVTMGPENKVHAWRMTGLDEEQRKIMLALGFKNKSLRILKRTEIAG